MTELQTRKDDFSSIRIVETPAISLNQGEIALKVDRFSFTANNITYAVMGEQLRYWQFFPPSGDDSQNWGIIPVWGFATVTQSKSQEVSEGERLFGYFPPASELKIKPANVSASSLFDGSDHRAELPPGYNIYRRVSGEPNYNPDFDQERMLLFPLYVTAFCLHDMLQSENWFDAEQVIIGSASSKTSIGLAYAIEEDGNAPKLIGLTSTRNRDVVASLGIYSEVVTYDKLESIDANRKTVIVDMSANGEVLGRLHTHLNDNMRFCSNVGLTHWENAQPGKGFIQERSKMFFAPGHIQQRMKDWGPEGFNEKSNAFILRTAIKSRNWLKMEQVDGLESLSKVYDDVCRGRVPPEIGLIVNI